MAGVGAGDSNEVSDEGVAFALLRDFEPLAMAVSPSVVRNKGSALWTIWGDAARAAMPLFGAYG